MGKEKTFEVGDFVFAKIRGYPAWPARILSVNEPALKYTVFFFGTSETATVLSKDIFLFAPNREKLGKPMKRKFFNESVKEVEEELEKIARGEVSTKGLPAGGKQDGPVKIRKPKDSIGEENEASTSSEGPSETKLGKRKKESVGDAPSAKKKKRRTVSEENPSEIDGVCVKDHSNGENGETSAPKETVPGKKRLRDSESLDSSGQSKEQVSRSGRVIKPKKFLYDGHKDNDESAKAKNLSDQDNQSKEEPAPKKRKSKAPKEAKEVSQQLLPPISSPKLSSIGRVMWVRSKCGQLVQVSLDHERPDSFKDEKTRVQWEKAYEQHVKKVRKRIESGESLPEDVVLQLKPSPERLATMTEDEIVACEKRRVVERKRGKLRWLKVETRLVDMEALLRTCLQKTKVNVDKALSLLDELISLPLDPLMLKKHPQVVDTTKKIRQYTGNLKRWNMTPEEVSNFKAKATKIRQKANILLNKFRALFAVPKSDDFWNVFVNSVNEFNNLTKDLPRVRVYSLIVDPTSPYYQEISDFDKEEEEFGKELLEKGYIEKEAIS